MMSKERHEAVRVRLDALAESNGGRITPQLVVDDARDLTSPLHDLFNWNESEAARQHWLDTARAIIRSVRVEFITHTRSVETVAYVRDPTANADEQGYMRTAKLRGDEDLARVTVVSEYSRAAAALRRARDLAEVLGVQEETDRIIQDVDGVRASVEVRAQ